MNSDQRIAMLIGDLAIKNCQLAAQVEEQQAQIAALQPKPEIPTDETKSNPSPS